MKTVYSSTIIVSLFLFSAVLFPNYVGAAVCQNKTVIVYSNGMFTDAEAADTSKKELFKKLLASNSTYGDSNLYEYDLAYADGKGGPFGTTGLDQLLEVSRQAYGDKFMGWFWRALIGDGLI